MTATMATAGWDRAVKLWGLATGRERITLVGHTDRVGSLQFAPDGATLASISWNDGTVRLWNVDKAELQE